MKPLALAVVLLATAISPSLAQSADHDKHHPDQKDAPAAQQPTSPKGQPGMGGSGMGGSSKKGMMGGGGMMNSMAARCP